jgi:SnoaL-like domain
MGARLTTYAPTTTRSTRATPSAWPRSSPTTLSTTTPASARTKERRTIGEYTKLAVAGAEGRWELEHGIEQGDEACIEWTMTWRDPDTGERRLNRGTEWFRFRDDLICEVRAYFHSGRRNRSGDLTGFDHAGRGYTVLE